jgi:hypothetical protein
VLLFRHGACDRGFVVRQVRSEHGTRTRLIELPGWVAHLTKLGARNASASAIYGLLEMLPEPGLKLESDFASICEQCPVNAALQKT